MSKVKTQVARDISRPALVPPRGRPQVEPLAASGGRRRLFVAGCLAAGDLCSGAVAVAVAAFVGTRWPGDHEDAAGWLSVHMPVSLLLLMAVYCFLGLYGAAARNLLERFRLRVMAVALYVFAGSLLLIREAPSIGLFIVPLAGAIALVLGSWTEHFIGRSLIRRGAWGAPTAILGADDSGRALARLLMAHADWGLKPIGFIADGISLAPDLSEVDTTDGGEGDAASALPLLGSLDTWQADGRAEILAVPDSHSLRCDQDALHHLGFKSVLLLNPVGEIPTFGLHVRHFDRWVALEFGSRRHSPSQLVKRTIDLAVTVPMAILLAPIVALLAIMIKRADPGPAFYGQWRIGCNGQPIRILKLRTMYRDADQRLERVLAQDPAAREEWKRFFKLSNDPRVLPRIGNFLRRTSLDEVPQIWNVIRGDMSLVGPRPFPDYHMNAFDPEFRALRVSVPPGLTGLWQISSRSDGDLEIQRSQDSYYIRNRSLWLDLYILLATLPAVLSLQGAK
jgi:lipopolysaccharide/colanic/teichoic acid biosynthesis glycosyltransferase